MITYLILVKMRMLRINAGKAVVVINTHQLKSNSDEMNLYNYHF